MVGLVEQVSASLKKNQASARERYYTALRSRDAAAIAAASVEAGIAPSQVEADARILERSAELAAMVANLPAAQRAWEDWTKKLEAASEKLQKTVEPLEDAVNTSAMECQAAQKPCGR